MTISHDQMYLSQRLGDLQEDEDQHLTPAAVELLNQTYGMETVTGMMRLLHGFPPRYDIHNMYTYLKKMCATNTGQVAPWGGDPTRF